MNLLFVCIENSNRSQMAEAFAKMYNGKNISAYSAGSNPSGKVNPKAIAAMKELNYDLSKHISKSLKDIPEIEYDFVVSMGCGDKCPWVAAKQRLEWELEDPRNMEGEDFNQIRDRIQSLVNELLLKHS